MNRTTRRVTLLSTLALALGGCSALGIGGGESEEARRASCDRLAAQAVDAEDIRDARQLAAQATDCYAAEIARRG
jgi:hypothetical protein